jgi:hypothetical protein
VNTVVLHEVVDLAKSLAWPAVSLFCLIRYSQEVKTLLLALSAALERMKTAKGLGVELELAQTAESASSEAEQIDAVPRLPVFKPIRSDDGGER